MHTIKRTRLLILMNFLFLTTIISAQSSIVLDLQSNNLNFSDANRTVVTNTGSSSTGLPGTATGSVHRYDNLFTNGVINLSAYITLTEVLNADIYKFDEDITFPGRFQPGINSMSSTGGRVVYKVDFFDANTNLPVCIYNYYFTIIDIDGNNTVPLEFVEFDNYSSYTVNNPTNLTISTDLASGRTKATSGVATVTGIAFEDYSALVANYNNASSTITFAFGMLTSSSQTSGRQYSLQFGVPISNFRNPFITLNPCPLATDDFGDDIISNIGGVSISNIFLNDTFLGLPINNANFTTTILTPSTEPGVVLNPLTGEVTVAPGTPVGNYTIEYKITLKSDIEIYDKAKVSVKVITQDNSISTSIINQTFNISNFKSYINKKSTDIKDINIIVYNLEGKAITSMNNFNKINISDFKPGIYLLKIQEISGDVYKFKLLVD